MRSDWSMDRRSVLRLGLIVAALGAVGGQVIASPARAAVEDDIVEPSEAVTESEPTPVRYRFYVSTRRKSGAGEFGRLEEVWAFTEYLRITSCDVTYVGPGEHTLTLEESEVVRVAEDLGAVITDRPAYYRMILEACTRIHPSEWDARVAELGVPGVSAALALAPEAPQAGKFREWLGIDDQPVEELPPEDLPTVQDLPTGDLPTVQELPAEG